MDDSVVPMANEVCNSNTVKLQSCDGEIFEVETEVASSSDIIKLIMGDLGTNITIPLPLVSANTLRLVIQYCRYHVHDAPTASLDAVKTWDDEFVKTLVDGATLFEVTKAADYLVIRNLLDFMCQTNNNNQYVILQSCDGEIFVVEREVASTSAIIKLIMDDSGTNITIPLPGVSAKILRLVIQYCRYHVLDAPTASLDAVKTWDEEFVRPLVDDRATLFQVTEAADYMMARNLLDFMCQTIVDMMKGKTADEMRELFTGLNIDYSLNH